MGLRVWKVFTRQVYFIGGVSFDPFFLRGKVWIVAEEAADDFFGGIIFAVLP